MFHVGLFHVAHVFCSRTSCMRTETLSKERTVRCARCSSKWRPGSASPTEVGSLRLQAEGVEVQYCTLGLQPHPQQVGGAWSPGGMSELRAKTVVLPTQEMHKRKRKEDVKRIMSRFCPPHTRLPKGPTSSQNTNHR